MSVEVYIVGVKAHLPKIYDSMQIIDVLYNENRCSPKVNKFAKRLASNMHIKGRAVSIDLNAFPKKIVPQENAPVIWATTTLKHLVKDETIDFLSISYNTSSHKKTIPNIACQTSNACNLSTKIPPEEIVNYGCASGVFSLKSALNYCSNQDSTAFIFAYEQSSFLYDPILDIDHVDFKSSLRSNAIFGDGSAGLLLVSGENVKNYDKKLRIIDVVVEFKFGDVIKMEDHQFLTQEGVKDVMPQLVSESVKGAMKCQ